MKPLILICTSIFVFGMFLTACTTPDPIIEERIVEVEKIVVVEKIVEVVVEVTATAEAVDSSASVTVDSILGDWDGKILAMGLQIGFNITLEMADDGSISGLFSVPVQGIVDEPLGVVTFDGTTLTMSEPTSGVTFSGEYDSGTVKGQFDNEGMKMGFNMTHVD